MVTEQGFAEALRQRLVVAAMGASVASGCTPTTEPAEPAPTDRTATATVTGVVIAEVPPNAPAVEPTVAPLPPTVETTAATPVKSGKPVPDQPRKRVSCGGASSKEQCFTPFGSMRSIGTGGPAPALPPEAFDSNGCLHIKEVSNGCCNSAAGGPRLAGGKCCYEFCEGPCCGRAFVVDGAARVAGVSSSRAWLGSDRDLAAPLGLETTDFVRAAAAQAWLADAQMEHASIASFGRFVLELLALGAPASMVRDAGEAMLDEVHHAELCFAIAERLGAGALGPRPLAIDGALSARGLADVIAAVVVEGCVGETIAALVAARQLEAATDPFVRAALERVATDEARHAELGWRFLRWGLDAGGDAARRAALAAFVDALRDERLFGVGGYAQPFADDTAWRRLGRLTRSDLEQVVRSARDTVLGPAVESLKLSASC